MTGKSLSCTDTGLTPNAPYTYTVEAYDVHDTLIETLSATVNSHETTVPKILVTADKPAVSPGSPVTAHVAIENASDLYAEDVTVTYDPTLFTFVSATSASAGLKIYHQSESTPGTLHLVVVSQGAQYGVHDSAQLVTLNLQAKNHSGKGTFTVSEGLVANSLGEEIVPTLGGTEVSVLTGDADVNGDGKVSLGDLGIAGHHMGMDKSQWTFPKADVDQNNAVDDFDLTAIVLALLSH
ncbi:cohesin domain-containing protein [Tumebacillus permanentifrigoris]|nr:cohesin domain-containing protein [Tumebacillus permanentifrigoris]